MRASAKWAMRVTTAVAEVNGARFLWGVETRFPNPLVCASHFGLDAIVIGR